MSARLLVLASFTGVLSAGVLAQVPALTLPSLTLPPGASLLRAGTWPEPSLPLSSRPQPTADPEQQYSAGLTTRFLAAGDVASTAAHYGAQLVGLKWRKSFESGHPSMAVHRYMVDSPTGTQLGSLLVLAVPEQKYHFVGVRLARSHLPWRWQPGGRSGGGGANGAMELTLPPLYNRQERLRLPELQLPATVRRLEQRGGGASSDAFYVESRFDTFDTPRALMDALEPQFAREGWKAGLTGGDAVQTYRSFMQSDSADYIVCVVLTSVPGANGVDSAIWAIRNR